MFDQSIFNERTVQHEITLAKDVISERVAQYVRMSKDVQNHSTHNQVEAISAYALAHNLTVVRTYADEGRSGLLFDSRPGLKHLLSDVQNGLADYTAVLVYDISRWGRFQDVDEGTYYEQLCKRAGVRVIYCAEEFNDDISMMSTIIKALRRADAADYSRRLSTRIFAGQCNLVRRGFWQGASAGYGLRRGLIDARGVSKGTLERGERKFIQSDRVILVPGPKNEVETVRRVFHAFVSELKSTTKIAKELNSEGITNGYDRPWTQESIKKILTSEKYAGTNLFNRHSKKLKGRTVRNAPEEWIRVENAFEPIVDASLFAVARKISRKNSYGITNEEMLSRLAALLAKTGQLSCKIINEAEGLPHNALYRARFGKISAAYEQIGYEQKSFVEWRAIKRALADRFVDVAAKVTSEIEKAGLSPIYDEASSTFTIGTTAFSLFVVRYAHTAAKDCASIIRCRKGFATDHIVAVRMDQTNSYPLDYFLLPTNRMHPYRINLTKRDSSLINIYRFQSLDRLVASIRKLVVAETGGHRPGPKY